MKRREIIRREDALKFLDRALAAPPKSKARQTRLEHALLVYYFGTINQNHFGTRGDRRRGRARYDANEARAVMAGISKATGETRRYVLAGLAIDSGKVGLNGAKRATVIRRLARLIDK